MSTLNDEETEIGRSEKLAAARKKLKQFQKRHKTPGGGVNLDKENRPLSAAFPGYSSESLAESTKSADKFLQYHSGESPQAKRYSVSSLPSGAAPSTSPSAFYHDEHRSPFHRIKRASESSETSSIPMNFKIAEDRKIFNDTFLDEEAGTSHDDLNDENGQATPKFEEFQSNSVLEKNFSSANNNADRLTNIFNEIRPKIEQMASNLDDIFSRTNNDSTIFNSTTSDLQVQLLHQNLETNLQLENKNEFTPAEPSNRNSAAEIENAALKHQYNELQAYCQQISTQLNDLNASYTQLYAAYANLSTEHNNVTQTLRSHHLRQAMTQNEMQNDAQKQVQQHLQTINILVDEKTDLQSQLRQAMEIANNKHLENEELKGRLKASRERLTLLEKEFETQTAARTSVETTLERQHVEMERIRKESAQYQAKVTELQQDKSELSARLKVRNREVDDLLAKLKEAEKQIQMKDIYIGQLSGGHSQTAVTDELERQRGENEMLSRQLNECRQIAESWKHEADQLKERYESYGRQLNLKIVQLSGELEKLANEKLDVEMKLQRLETELQSLNSNDKSSANEISSPSSTSNVEGGEEFSALKNQYAELKEELQNLLAANSCLQSSLIEKDKLVENLEENSKEFETQIKRLKEFIASSDKTNSDVQSLLEQLHSEKVTSSRAVAQNITLKSQLAEIEDKFVSVTQTEMDMATKLDSAQRSIEILNAQLIDKTEETNKIIEQHEEKYKSLQAQVNAQMKDEYDRKQFEDRLRHYEATQKAAEEEITFCRNEIGRLSLENTSLRQNLIECEENLQSLNEEQQQSSSGGDRMIFSDEDVINLRMELTQAMQRIQHLSTENAELHRIMEHNAADENQNTIHVELRQAVDRMTSLSRENDDLRRNAVRLRDQLDASNSERDKLRETVHEIRNSAAVVVQQNNHEEKNNEAKNFADDRSSVCSEHFEQRRETINNDAFEKLKKAMEQLQARFTRTLTENADLTDQNEQLEHLIMQLQSETETIGEYVTIYQHQRKVIRERLREKEEYVARLSREKEEVQGKLVELQHLLMHLLKEQGALHSYPQLPPTHARPLRSPPSKMPERPRNLSETLIDETNEQNVNVLSRAASEPTTIVVAQEASEQEISPYSSKDHSVRSDRTPSPVGGESNKFVSNNEIINVDVDSPTAERILKLLMEMQRPDLINTLPPTDRSLHCKYCTGKLLLL